MSLDDDIKAALNSLDFPAGKEDIVRHAEGASAAEHVVKALKSLPLGDYGNMNEVLRSTPDS